MGEKAGVGETAGVGQDAGGRGGAARTRGGAHQRDVGKVGVADGGARDPGVRVEVGDARDEELDAADDVHEEEELAEDHQPALGRPVRVEVASLLQRGGVAEGALDPDEPHELAHLAQPQDDDRLGPVPDHAGERDPTKGEARDQVEEEPPFDVRPGNLAVVLDPAALPVGEGDDEVLEQVEDEEDVDQHVDPAEDGPQLVLKRDHPRNDDGDPDDEEEGAHAIPPEEVVGPRRDDAQQLVELLLLDRVGHVAAEERLQHVALLALQRPGLGAGPRAVSVKSHLCDPHKVRPFDHGAPRRLVHLRLAANRPQVPVRELGHQHGRCCRRQLARGAPVRVGGRLPLEPGFLRVRRLGCRRRGGRRKSRGGRARGGGDGRVGADLAHHARTWLATRDPGLRSVSPSPKTRRAAPDARG